MTKIGSAPLKMGGTLLCHPAGPGPGSGPGLFSSEVGRPGVPGSPEEDGPLSGRHRLAGPVLDAEGFLSPHPGFLQGPGRAGPAELSAKCSLHEGFLAVLSTPV